MEVRLRQGLSVRGFVSTEVRLHGGSPAPGSAIGPLVLTVQYRVKMAESIRVLSYNTHQGIGMDGRYDLRRVADVVNRADADVVALQEVNRHRKEKTNYDDQVSRYEERLGLNGQYGVVLEEEATEASGGEPRRMGQLVLSRHPIESADVHHLPSQQESQPRAVVRTHIDVDGTDLSFDTVHLGVKHEERKQQVEQLLELTDDVEPNRVLVGDCNAAADSEPILTLKAEFREAFAVRGKEPARTHPSPYVEESPGDKFVKTYRPRTQSDYVFVGDDVTVERAELRHSLASDHSPVLADLTLSV